jgi:hypothetical protein
MSEITLSDGKLEIATTRPGTGNLSLELENVSYADVIGDGKEDAIVTVAGITGANRFLGAVFVYTIEKDEPRLLWQHETGDRADGGLRRISVENGMLTLEEYTRSERDGGLCCPKKFIRSSYRWNGEDFEKSKAETLPNEYDNARFLGYPGNQKGSQ